MKSFGEYITEATANSKIMPEILKYAKSGDIDKVNEDSKGTLTKEGDSLVSKFVNIKNVSKLVTDEMTKFDKEKGDKVVSKSANVTWDAKSDFNHIEIHFDAISKDVQSNGEEKGNVNYTGVITINPISSEIKSKIEVK
jgi:hypothetical protein